MLQEAYELSRDIGVKSWDVNLALVKLTRVYKSGEKNELRAAERNDRGKCDIG